MLVWPLLLSSFLVTFLVTSEMDVGCHNQSPTRPLSEPGVTYLAEIAGQQTKGSPRLCLSNAAMTDTGHHAPLLICVLGTECRFCGAGVFTAV